VVLTFLREEFAMKQQRGFTLIVRVVVIAIQGILAAVALPKFVSLTSDARIAKMKGAAGAVSAGSALIHARYLASGSPASGTIAYEGGTLQIGTDVLFGYPSAAIIPTVAGLSSDYTTTVAAGVATIADNNSANCTISYTQVAAAGGAPAVDSTTNLTTAKCP
jgi:MSHA pilin protein MshA